MKITSIDTIETSMTVNPRLAIVSAAGTHPESHYLVVRIRSDEGAEGFGEATVAPVWSGETQAGARAAIRNILAPALARQDPREVRRLAAVMDRVLISEIPLQKPLWRWHSSIFPPRRSTRVCAHCWEETNAKKQSL